MPFSSFLRGALPVVSPLLGGAAGLFFGGPAGLAAGAQAGSGIGGLLSNLIGQEKTPFQEQAEQAQMGLLQQLSQRPQFNRVNFDPIRQEELRRFREDIVPSITHRLAQTGTPSSSYFEQALGRAGSDLGSRLAALQAQHEVGQQGAERAFEGQNLSRLGQLSGFLSGQEQQGLLQEQARQQRLGNLFGLGQQAAAQSLRQQDLYNDLLRNYGQQAGAMGLGQAPQIPQGFWESMFSEFLPRAVGAGLRYRTGV